MASITITAGDSSATVTLNNARWRYVAKKVTRENTILAEKDPELNVRITQTRQVEIRGTLTTADGALSTQLTNLEALYDKSSSSDALCTLTLPLPDGGSKSFSSVVFVDMDYDVSEGQVNIVTFTLSFQPARWFQELYTA